jgi:hypothetical protein
MPTKKTTATAIAITITVLLLLGAGILISIRFVPQSTLPTCAVSSEGTDLNYYKCPNNVDSCSVDIKLECDTRTSEPLVIFRTDGDTKKQISSSSDMKAKYEDKWVAVDLNPSDENYALTRFTYEGRGTDSDGDCFGQEKLRKADGTIIALNDGTNLVWRDTGTIKALYIINNCRQYAKFELAITNQNIETSTSPVLKYSLNNQEVVAGSQDIYQCSQDITGSREETITYSGKEDGETLRSFNLNSGDAINWDGRIDWEEISLRLSQCVPGLSQADSSDKSMYYECKPDNLGCGFLDINNPQFCDVGFIFDENEQECIPPYTLEITTNKELYSNQDNIEVIIEIKDTVIRGNKEILVTLVDANTNEQKTFVTSSTNARGETLPINLGNYPNGEYKIIAKTLNHELGEVIKEKKIKVTVPIFLSLDTSDFGKIQYSPSTIKVRAKVADSSGNPENVQRFEYDGSTCGSKSIVQEITSNREQTGVYILNVPIDEECDLTFKVRAVDNSGFKSEQDTLTITVNKASIFIQPELAPITDADAGRHTISFKTLDISQQPIDSSNIITILDSDGCESGKFCNIDNTFLPNAIVVGDNGFYTFTYDFKAGLNTIKIRSSAQNIESTTQEFTVNLFDRGGSGGGDDTPGGIDLSIIITAIVVLGGLALFFWFVFRKK